ncbi:hypothetical protein GCM10023335_02520 [Streptomyces siamensis]|uniref:Uncharacterized protein n=1 Tax=Streptomyces siamensis TaxID=1274986 RepID=A0ABP9IBQ3_9ACTN
MTPGSGTARDAGCDGVASGTAPSCAPPDRDALDSISELITIGRFSDRVVPLAHTRVAYEARSKGALAWQGRRPCRRPVVKRSPERSGSALLPAPSADTAADSGPL